MMSTTRLRWVMGAVFAAAALSAGRALSDDGAASLGPRYTDTLTGYSLRPPVDTQRIKSPSASLLVSWVSRDEKTGAIAWTLSVQRVTEGNPDVDMKKYGEALAEKFRKEERYQIDKVNLTTVSGLPAIELVGVTKGSIRLWRKQVWVRTEVGRKAENAAAGKGGTPARPTRFLVFVISGSSSQEGDMDRVFSAVMKTVKIRDTEKANVEREENLGRGAKLLAGLDEKKIAAAVHNEPQWFLWTYKGKHVGFMRVTETAVNRPALKGARVTTETMLQLPGDQVRLSKSSLFSTPDTLLEEWIEQMQVGAGPEAMVLAQKCTMVNGEKIICDSSRQGSVKTHERPISPKVKDIYLSRATGTLLPRLVDRKTPAAYAFAVYNPQANDFDMRTFRIVAPDKITLDGKEVVALYATDQLAADVEPASLWLADDGTLLKMETAEGLTMTRADRQQVLKAYPNADSVVRGMAKWAELK